MFDIALQRNVRSLLDHRFGVFTKTNVIVTVGGQRAAGAVRQVPDYQRILHGGCGNQTASFIAFVSNGNSTRRTRATEGPCAIAIGTRDNLLYSVKFLVKIDG